MTRKYVVRLSDAEDDPIIDSGASTFYIDDHDLAPDGYELDVVQNTPELKTIYVSRV